MGWKHRADNSCRPIRRERDMYGNRLILRRLLFGVTGVLSLLMVAQFAESSAVNNKCCIHPWISTSIGGGCYCNTSGWVNSCDDLATAPCSATPGWNQAKNGFCASRTGQNCDPAGTTTLTESSGSYACERYTILSCSRNSDCGCRFSKDWFPNTRAATVNECSGDECSL